MGSKHIPFGIEPPWANRDFQAMPKLKAAHRFQVSEVVLKNTGYIPKQGVSLRPPKQRDNL